MSPHRYTWLSCGLHSKGQAVPLFLFVTVTWDLDLGWKTCILTLTSPKSLKNNQLQFCLISDVLPFAPVLTRPIYLDRISWPRGGVAVWWRACGGVSHSADRVWRRWLLYSGLSQSWARGHQCLHLQSHQWPRGDILLSQTHCSRVNIYERYFSSLEKIDYHYNREYFTVVPLRILCPGLSMTGCGKIVSYATLLQLSPLAHSGLMQKSVRFAS